MIIVGGGKGGGGSGNGGDAAVEQGCWKVSLLESWNLEHSDIFSRRTGAGNRDQILWGSSIIASVAPLAWLIILNIEIFLQTAP